jgi:hypothetical protein
LGLYDFASSSDGSEIVAASDTEGYHAYTSTDSGVTWTRQDDTEGLGLYNFASSSDGSKIVATSDNNGYVYTYSAPITTPSLTTSAVSNITRTTVTFNGTITDDGGDEPTVEFRYGLTVDYGSSVTVDGTYATDESFSAEITGLTCGTTYHVEAFAENSTEEAADGGDVTFTTSACASAGGSSSNVPAPACASVTYGEWGGICFNGLQYRNVNAQSPNGCSPTASQRLAASRTCQNGSSGNSSSGTSNSNSSSGNTAEINAEKELTIEIDLKLMKRLAGRILLRVEYLGQAWYLDPVSLKRYFLADGASAYQALRRFGLGIKNIDLDKIPVASDSALPTNYIASKTGYSTSLVNRLKGRIVLQVEDHGEAWYINPVDGKRYYLANGDAAYRIMKYLSLGISDADIHKITVGE